MTLNEVKSSADVDAFVKERIHSGLVWWAVVSVISTLVFWRTAGGSWPRIILYYTSFCAVGFFAVTLRWKDAGRRLKSHF